jgi:hypothetical protein
MDCLIPNPTGYSTLEVMLQQVVVSFAGSFNDLAADKHSRMANRNLGIRTGWQQFIDNEPYRKPGSALTTPA